MEVLITGIIAICGMAVVGIYTINKILKLQNNR